MEVSELVPGFTPETPLEARLAEQDELRAGLAWCCPGRGHPEGPVGRHVATLLAGIRPGAADREDLRVLALVHDSFKAQVDRSAPYAPSNDHAVLARRFAEHHIRDERILAALELHDAPYWIWRHGRDQRELQAVLERIPDLDLFRRFVALDASTPGKDPAFLRWFHRALQRTAA